MVDTILQQAEAFCEALIEKYDENVEITDMDICELIEILRGRA